MQLDHLLTARDCVCVVNDITSNSWEVYHFILYIMLVKLFSRYFKCFNKYSLRIRYRSMTFCKAIFVRILDNCYHRFKTEPWYRRLKVWHWFLEINEIYNLNFIIQFYWFISSLSSSSVDSHSSLNAADGRRFRSDKVLQ